MPRNYRKRRVTKRNKKKRFTRRRKTNLRSMVIRGPPVVPDRTFVKLKYFRENANLITGSASVTFSFRGNGAYDPETGLGGHSPLGYDQWAQLYQNYRVHKSSIFITPTSTTVPFNFSITPSTFTNRPNSTALAKELPYTRYRTVGNMAQGKGVGVRNTMYSKKIFGVKSISYEDGFRSDVGNVPQDQWFWVMNISSYNGSAITLLANIEVIYWVEFFNRYELGQSGIIGDHIGVNGQDTPFGQTGPTGPNTSLGGDTGPTTGYGDTAGSGI